jgi:ATP-dependent Clp protease ATP-binding subunit ClpC
MFERFTDRARRVVVLAQDEARVLNHNYIGTEHLLLALIGEGDGIAGQALQSLGITQKTARQQVEEIIGRGRPGPRSDHLPFSPQAKKALELTLREALRLGHNYIGTEHILLGLTDEGEGPVAQVLAGLGTDLTTVRRQVFTLLPGGKDRDDSGPVSVSRLSGKGGRGKRRQLSALVDRFDSMESRLLALERRVGASPDMRDIDRDIKQARRDKESAIDHQDFETAALLRDKEKRLLDERASRQQDWAATHLDLPSLSEEVERLRGLLRQHGIEPHDGAA